MEYQGRQKNNKDTFTKTANPVQNDTSAQLAKNPSGGNQMQQLQSQANSSGLVGGLTQLQSIADQHTDLKAPIQRKENTTGLPDQLKSGVENLSGMSLDDVKVHRNSDKPAQLNAHAYAQGTDIHLGPGQEKHLPHEAWHVVQQKEGRVKPTKQMKGKVNVNDDAGLEKEADIMGQKALQMHQMDPVDLQDKFVSYNTNLSQLMSVYRNSNSIIQMKGGKDGIDFKKFSAKSGGGAAAADSQAAGETMVMTNNPTIDMKALKAQTQSDIDFTSFSAKASGGESDEAFEMTKNPIFDVEALQAQNFTENNNIIKFNFAGSGEEAWKTHKIGKKKDYRKEGLDYGERQNDFYGRKFKKEKETIGGHKTVFEYAGPMTSWMGKKGILDKSGLGDNSTEENLADAKSEMIEVMSAVLAAKLRGLDQTVEVDIKGFSRGAATATVFANWIKATYPEVPINLVAIDPVHGTGSWEEGSEGEKDMGYMDHEQDLSAIDNSTYVLPITSGHGWTSQGAFRPQKVFNYSRIIIMYGPNVKHSMAMGGKTGSVLTYNGEPIKGTKLGTLPQGLFVADSTDPSNMEIKKISSEGEWEAVSPRILGGGYLKKDKSTGRKADKKVNKKEHRDKMIQDAFAQFIKSGHVITEMYENPAFNHK